MRRFVAIGLCIALSGCDANTVTSRYATLEDAKADELFGRGWLPEILPPSATQIRTSNQLDLNVSEGEFSFAPAEAGHLIGHLSRGVPAESRLAGWDETVDSYTRRGYSTWSFKDEDSTWVFFCLERRGYCEYRMWLR